MCVCVCVCGRAKGGAPCEGNGPLGKRRSGEVPRGVTSCTDSRIRGVTLRLFSPTAFSCCAVAQAEVLPFTVRPRPPRAHWQGDYGGGGRILRQVTFAVVNFAVGNFAEPCGLSGSCPRQSPQCVLLVYEKFAENPECRARNFAVNLKREISQAKLKCHETPPPFTGGGRGWMGVCPPQIVTDAEALVARDRGAELSGRRRPPRVGLGDAGHHRPRATQAQ